jgi:hypothetical protein
MINADLAEQGAKTGMLLASSRADRFVDDWTDQATVFFKLYARLHGHKGFMTEDVRLWATKLGFESAPDQRAWGLIARRLSSEGYIKADGFGKQRSATCHGSPKTIWKTQPL